MREQTDKILKILQSFVSKMRNIRITNSPSPHRCSVKKLIYYRHFFLGNFATNTTCNSHAYTPNTMRALRPNFRHFGAYFKPLLSYTAQTLIKIMKLSTSNPRPFIKTTSENAAATSCRPSAIYSTRYLDSKTQTG